MYGILILWAHLPGSKVMLTWLRKEVGTQTTILNVDCDPYGIDSKLLNNTHLPSLIGKTNHHNTTCESKYRVLTR